MTTRNIELPFRSCGEEKIFITNHASYNAGLISGYIRGYCNDGILDIFAKLTMEFYDKNGTEWIHVINYTGQHWKIPLNEVLDL